MANQVNTTVIWKQTSGQFGKVDVLFINRLVSGSISPTNDNRFVCMIKRGLTDIVSVRFNDRNTCKQHICVVHSIPFE